MNFKLISDYKPAGDQPFAIKKIVKSLKSKNKYQVLKGVTASGKTFTMANIIEELQKPSLIISHNKTLAAQLFREFKNFFPENAVEYFVSYYDYYQPESYVPSRDLYIEKEASINKEIEVKRIKAATALAARRDVIVVSTVSAIYSIGSPIFFKNSTKKLYIGLKITTDLLSREFIKLQYERTFLNLERGKFSIKGDLVEIWPSYEDLYYRIYLDFDEIVKIERVEHLNKKVRGSVNEFTLFAVSYFVIPQERIAKALTQIESDLKKQYDFFKKEGKDLEAFRIKQRVEYDMEMLRETGFCTGIENYSKYFNDSNKERPWCLLDYFVDDYITFIDESHVTVPQIRAMYNGDRVRKLNLVNFGFRLPSALENRPLKYDEFDELTKQLVYVSATPAKEELEISSTIVEQIVRPTGLLDPQIIVRESRGQLEDLYRELGLLKENREKALILTLTKKMAEDLTDYLLNLNVKAKYIHSELNTLERVDVITDLRRDKIDVIVGINLLREGLDIPEVALVAILDADKVGFLRSTSSLIQIIGRAARNSKGLVIMYCDKISDSMREAIDETQRRRELQIKFNEQHSIEPKTIVKKVENILERELDEREDIENLIKKEKNVKKLIKELEFKLQDAILDENFEEAIVLRDKIKEIKDYKGRKKR